jgi:Septum formation
MSRQGENGREPADWWGSSAAGQLDWYGGAQPPPLRRPSKGPGQPPIQGRQQDGPTTMEQQGPPGAGWPQPHNPFPRSAGPGTFGPASAGPDTFDPASAGPDTFRPAPAGPDTFRPASAGPDTFGPGAGDYGPGDPIRGDRGDPARGDWAGRDLPGRDDWPSSGYDPAPPATPGRPRRSGGLVAAVGILGLLLGAAAASATFLALGWGPDDGTTSAARSPSSASASPSAKAPAARPRSALIDDLEVGECFNLPDGPILRVAVVSCSTPHNRELFARLTLPDGSWPGEAEIKSTGLSKCGERFAGYVGSEHGASVYTYQSIRPTEQTWADGDRLVACAIKTRDDKAMRVRARGSGR